MTLVDPVPLANTSGEQIPSFAVAKVAGVTDSVVQAAKPDADNDANFVVVGASAVPAAGKAQGTFHARVTVAYDASDGTPAAGETWGVKAGSWKLRKGYSGFVILGGAGNGVVNALRVAAASAAASSPVVKARAKSTGNVTVSAPGTALFDGVTLLSGDVLLLNDQTAPAENGPYVYNGSSSAMTRHADADTSAELVSCIVTVSEGTLNADTVWFCTTDKTITVGTTAIAFVRIYPADNPGFVKARAKSTGNVTVSNPGTSTFDGVTLSAGDVLFLADQTSAAQNGPYVFNGSSSALTRHRDADSSAELVNCQVVVSEGTLHGDTVWMCTTNAAITVGTTALTWERIYPASIMCEVTATDTGSGHTVKEKAWTGTAPGIALVDASTGVTYSGCRSTTGSALPVGTIVNLERYPLSGTVHVYRITPAMWATDTLPGMLSTADQNVAGMKHFKDGVAVSALAATQVQLMPALAQTVTPSSTFAAPAPYTPTNPTTEYLNLNFAGGTGAGIRVFPGAGQPPYGELWVAGPTLLILTGGGRYATIRGGTNQVYAGLTGTPKPGAVFDNGILTDLGSLLAAIGSLTDSTGGTAGSTLSAVSGTGADATINSNFASLAAKVNALVNRLQGASITS